MNTGLENADLERLNESDKVELRQFLANEQQRSHIQTRMSLCAKPLHPGKSQIMHSFFHPSDNMTQKHIFASFLYPR